MKTRTYGYDRLTGILLIGLTLCILVVAVVGLLQFGRFWIAGAVAFLYAGLGYGVLQLNVSKPWLIVDEEGVHDCTPEGVGLVVWTDIQDAYYQRLRYTTSMCLKVSDPEKYLQRYNAVKRFGSKWNSAIGFTQITIPMMSIRKREAQELLELIKERASRNKTEQQAAS